VGVTARPLKARLAQHRADARRGTATPVSVWLRALLFYPELLAAGEAMTPDALDGSPFQQAYARDAPHPDQWQRLVAKVAELDRVTTGWPPEAIAALTTPTLLIIGDSDIVRPEHMVAMFRLLGGGVVGDLVGLPRSQLAVLPGTTHATLVDRAAWLTSMITAFLDRLMGDDQQAVLAGRSA
jgi:pimeloyl-ACP methyl ester carboxylesterase